MVIAKIKSVKGAQISKTIKNMEYNWVSRTLNPEPPNNQETGLPKAVFIPHSNSLPFEERHVTLEHSVKIGRNVCRATPSPTNTIFECRVLSRHHATLYYDKGHFYLVDNESSNGTFVNNNRCTLTNSEPHEVFSGDVVQFGIPVVENAGNSERHPFPPVIALLKLYHPDGKEAQLSFNPSMTTPLHLKELYQLNNFVQEAVQREASLESRLRTLRECVERTRAEAAASWDLFVGEQRLLMRVHTLEATLAAGKHPDAVQVSQLLSDKRNYQEVAQESLRMAHEQRLSLEESLERRSREAAALHHQNYSLHLAATNAMQELQKLAARCERKMCAARLAVSAAEEREQALRKHLPLAYSVQNGEAKMLVVSTDSNKLQEAKRSGTLEEAVRALPDYIKLLLPQHLLNKVGIKAVSAEGKSAKEFELILKKNSLHNSEGREKQEKEEDGVGGSGEKPGDADLCTDDEKHSRLNHDTPNDVESSSPPDGELRPDNNANSTYSEPDIKEESPSKAGVEFANILRVMAGLNEEIKVLRERVGAAAAENDTLRAVRDELLAARDERPPDHDEHDAAAARAARTELQEQLARAAATEEANLAKIQRLTASAAEMQAELAFRPTRADVDDLAALVAELRADALARDRLVERLQAELRDRTDTVDRSVETSTSLEDLRAAVDADDAPDPGQISAEIDEMFRLDSDDEDDESESVATEIVKEEGDAGPPGDYVRLDDGERLRVTLQNGSLHALEEELVRAKESWAEVCAERARLAAQLASAGRKQSRFDAGHALALAVPVLLACLCYLLLPYVS